MRRATRNVSYAALAGLEEAPEEAAFYRPLKRMARGGESVPAGSTVTHGASDTAFGDLWDRPHAVPRGGGGDSGDGAPSDPRHHQQQQAQVQAQARASLQHWVALQRQAAVAEERLRGSSHTASAGEVREGEDSLCTEELQEALKGFVQSIKAGASPPVVSVPPIARDRSFAALH